MKLTNEETLKEMRKATTGRKYPIDKYPNFGMRGKHHSVESILIMSQAKKDKTYEELYGKEKAEEMKRKQHIARMGKFIGENNPMYGKPAWNKMNLNEDEVIRLYPKLSAPKIAEVFNCSNEVIYRILKENDVQIENRTQFKKGQHGNPETEFKKGQHPSLSTEFEKGQMALEKHWNWQDGKSFEPYGLDFNNKFKESIRVRDNYCCVICNKMQEELGQQLSVHHIDYDKTNNFPQNCVSLCRSHHTDTNYNRDAWIVYFQKLLSERYNYEFTEDQKIILDFIR